MSKDRRCKRVKSIQPRHMFHLVEALVNCTPQAQCFRIARPLGIKLPKDRFGFEQRRLFVGLFGLVGRPRQLLNDVGIGLVALDGTPRNTSRVVRKSPRALASRAVFISAAKGRSNAAFSSWVVA